MIMSVKQWVDFVNVYELVIYVVKCFGLIDLMKVDILIEGMGCLENINVLLDGINVFVEEDILIDMEIILDKLLVSYL